MEPTPIARIAEVFPVPGAPQRRTGTRAATATPSAWTATDGPSMLHISTGIRVTAIAYPAPARRPS